VIADPKEASINAHDGFLDIEQHIPLSSSTIHERMSSIFCTKNRRIEAVSIFFMIISLSMNQPHIN
jgi:hypothetical protein